MHHLESGARRYRAKIIPEGEEKKMTKKLLPHLIHSLFSVMRPVFGPLALVVDKLDAVPEAQRGLYKQEEGGKYRLDVEGIEDNGPLKRALEAERDNVKAAKKELRDQAEKYKDIDPVRYRELMAKIDGDEELKLLSEGKHDEVFNRRTEKMRTSYETQLKQKDTEIEGERKKAGRYRDKVLDNAVRSAATKAGIHAGAVDDALLRARSVFQLDEQDNAVKLGEDKKPVLGPKGSVYSVDDWFEEMKEAASHWFPAGSTGSGAQSEKGGAGSAKTVKRAAFEKMSAVERSAFFKDGGKVVD